MVADEEEEDSDDDVEPIAEFRFVPSDKSALEAMFTAMCECQALHQILRMKIQMITMETNMMRKPVNRAGGHILHFIPTKKDYPI